VPIRDFSYIKNKFFVIMNVLGTGFMRLNPEISGDIPPAYPAGLGFAGPEADA